jgi:hypothetical protein
MTNPVMVDLTEGQKFKLPTNIEHYVRISLWYYISLNFLSYVSCFL